MYSDAPIPKTATLIILRKKRLYVMQKFIPDEKGSRENIEGIVRAAEYR